MTKVIVGLSGGVDSAVSAYLLKQQGYKVLGVFMQNWENDRDDEYCTIKQDSLDAIAVADCLNIDIEIVNFAKEYQDKVFSYFLNEYRLGRTPNPDILCNSEIKFKAFLEYAKNYGADKIATGHYVGKSKLNDQAILTIAADNNKDQSYFLYKLTQTQISNSIFPLCNITKPEVRKIAKNIKLPNANKKDSTGICFIGERPFKEFLQKYLPHNKGNVINLDGKILGTHLGLMYYTIGQRKGLAIGGFKTPLYVANKNLHTNELIVVEGKNHSMLFKQELIASDLNFYNNQLPQNGIYQAKTRYRSKSATCKLIKIDNHHIKLIFDTPQWAITPGQSVVIYQDNLCLGGGIIN